MSMGFLGCFSQFYPCPVISCRQNQVQLLGFLSTTPQPQLHPTKIHLSVEFCFLGQPRLRATSNEWRHSPTHPHCTQTRIVVTVTLLLGRK